MAQEQVNQNKYSIYKSDYANDRLTSHGDGGDGVDDVGEDDVVAGEVEFDGLGGRSIALKLASKMAHKLSRESINKDKCDVSVPRTPSVVYIIKKLNQKSTIDPIFSNATQ